MRKLFYQFLFFLCFVSILAGSEPLINSLERSSYQEGYHGNIERYDQLIEELDRPTGSPVIDEYLLGIIKGDYCTQFINEHFGNEWYSHLLFAIFCVEQGYFQSSKEVMSHIVLIDEDPEYEDCGINDKGEWVLPTWAPIYFLISSFQEGRDEMIDLIWPQIRNPAKAVFAAEYGDLKHFSEAYETYEWTEDSTRDVLKTCLSNAFASRKTELVDYLLDKENFESIDVVKAAAGGGGWAHYRGAIEKIDLDHVDLQELLKEGIFGCDYRIIQDLINRGAKLSDKDDIRSLLRTGIPELIHIGLTHIKGVEDQLFLGVSNSYGPFSDGVASWKPSLKSSGDVFFIGVTEDVLEDSKIMSLLSGMINPGSADTFPRTKEPFCWEDVLQNPQRKFTDTRTTKVKGMEEFYQTTITYAKEHYLPYLGLCGGSQHLVLHQGGYIHRVEGHHGSVRVSLIPGTISHYLAMTKEEKSAFYQTGNLPSLVIEDVKVAHNFAAVEGMLGFGIDLGGISEYNVPETFNRGLWMVGCQFHPEALYASVDESVNRNKQILDGYLELCLTRKALQKKCVDEKELISDMIKLERESMKLLQNAGSGETEASTRLGLISTS